MHAIEPVPGAVHGYFSAQLAPVLTVEPGERVRFQTLESGWGTGPYTGGSFPDRPRAPGWEPDIGHALTGPVAVRGARPGMTLSVRIDEVLPGSWGTCEIGRAHV